jgi:hypothetical protein
MIPYSYTSTNRAGRVLRYLAAVHAVTEKAENTYAANKTTRALAQPSAAAGMAHGYDHGVSSVVL